VDRKLRRNNTNVMGMYDILPTIGNMMGFEDKYALGHDIYDIKENNIVIFPNGNFVTNKVFYNNSTGDYMILNNNKNSNSVVISEDYIKDLKQYTEERLVVSNDIIVHNLIKKEGNNIVVLEGEDNNG
jgi:phosphoglycerol transferase MdoB-like AlkP superfamily enzyme